MTHPPPPPPLIPLLFSPGGLLFQASPPQHEGKKVCLCTQLAVETCTWKASCGSLSATARLCLRNGRFAMVVPAVGRGNSVRSPDCRPVVLVLHLTWQHKKNWSEKWPLFCQTDVNFKGLCLDPTHLCRRMENADVRSAFQWSVILHLSFWLTNVWLHLAIGYAVVVCVSLPHCKGMSSFVGSLANSLRRLRLRQDGGATHIQTPGKQLGPRQDSTTNESTAA